MKRIYMILLFSLINSLCFGQELNVKKSYIFHKYWVLQNKNLIKSITSSDEGVSITFHNDKKTRVFNWSEWKKIGNTLSYKVPVPDGALYIIEYEKDEIKYLFVTVEVLEGGKEAGYERNTRKFKFEF